MSGSDSSEQGIIEQYSSFFRLLGSSLTGITAMFMAAGFLAERARLAMLGLPATTFDLQQYLEVGARLIALLPVLAGNAVLLMIAGLFDSNTNHPPTTVLDWRRRRRLGSGNSRRLYDNTRGLRWGR